MTSPRAAAKRERGAVARRARPDPFDALLSSCPFPSSIPSRSIRARCRSAGMRSPISPASSSAGRAARAGRRTTRSGRRGSRARPREGVDDLLVYVALGVIIGGRLGHVLIYDPGFYLAHPLEILQTWKGGMAFHGGLIGAIIGMALFARGATATALPHRRRSFAPPSRRSGIFFGRLANFIKPEMWGRPTRRSLGDGLSRRPATRRAIRASSMRRASKASRSCSALVRRAQRRAEAAGPRHRPLRRRLWRWRASSANFSASRIPCRRRCRAASPWAWRFRCRSFSSALALIFFSLRRRSATA